MKFFIATIIYLQVWETVQGIECFLCNTSVGTEEERDACKFGDTNLVPKVTSDAIACRKGIKYTNDIEPEISRTVGWELKNGCIPTVWNFGQLLYECQMSGRLKQEVTLVGENNEELIGDARIFDEFCDWNLTSYAIYCWPHFQVEIEGGVEVRHWNYPTRLRPPLILPTECGNEWKQKDGMSMECYCATDSCNSY